MLLSCLLIVTSLCDAQNLTKPPIQIPTTRSSYFKLDKNGVILLDSDGYPYAGETENYAFIREFSPQNTVFFVVDPWNNMPSHFLNDYYHHIANNIVLPLTKLAAQKQFSIFIFTNRCDVIKPKPHSCSIPNEFANLTSKLKNVQLVYWQNVNIDSFVKTLRQTGIKNIIYLGFASNMCIIGRPLGMVRMKQEGFSLYFVPEASAAIETKESWQTQTIHKNTTLVISQWIAELMKYQDIQQALRRI